MDAPRISLDDDGTLDDFMARDVALVHFEALDDSQWYATVQLATGEVWQLNFGATNPRAKGYARAESAGHFPIHTEAQTRRAWPRCLRKAVEKVQTVAASYTCAQSQVANPEPRA